MPNNMIVLGVVSILLGTSVPSGFGLVYWWYKRKQKDKRQAAIDLMRLDQGLHECEVMDSFIESERLWKECDKNPGHRTFIPVSSFSLSSLPEEYRIPEIYRMIMNISSRTVRLRVNYSSPARPEAYPFFKFRGHRILHYGTGWIRDLGIGNGACKCPECVGKESAYKKWWKIRIHTACHVLFDTKEAKDTSVDIFYDSEASKSNGQMVTIAGLKVISKSEDQDLCRFYGATHDENLVKLLRDLTKQSYRKMPTELAGETGVWEENHSPLCVVVSHPHGKAKSITVGRCKGYTEENEVGEWAHIYDTDTCKGSSGAPVIVPMKLAGGGECDWVPHMYPHSGKAFLEPGLNQSAVGDRCSY